MYFSLFKSVKTIFRRDSRAVRTRKFICSGSSGKFRALHGQTDHADMLTRACSITRSLGPRLCLTIQSVWNNHFSSLINNWVSLSINLCIVALNLICINVHWFFLSLCNNYSYYDSLQTSSPSRKHEKRVKDCLRYLVWFELLAIKKENELGERESNYFLCLF